MDNSNARPQAINLICTSEASSMIQPCPFLSKGIAQTRTAVIRKLSLADDNSGTMTSAQLLQRARSAAYRFLKVYHANLKIDLALLNHKEITLFYVDRNKVAIVIASYRDMEYLLTSCKEETAKIYACPQANFETLILC